MFGAIYWVFRRATMHRMNPFSSGRATGLSDDGSFDDISAFVPEYVPEPGAFLDGHDVLDGMDHAAFHRLTRELFEERGVYDATFGYNLTRLNLDRRHPDAGYRYAIDADDPAILRAEFSPTTEFCPQADALVKGSFRAWNGLSDRHEYNLVCIRVRPTHHQAEALNDELERLERQYRRSGAVPEDSIGSRTGSGAEESRESDESSRRTPF
ncbi:hypothetical protein [Natrinema halophilum]|uniref:DUF7998 domain-containing protein n=1 Tax=Natrinema halophilum TaxID=1699371 RepID=A0A7D5GJ79_9EURY|nr:hypothetical protein [Natrinema halophilum]QLG47612.1 hypothetical protein HYG82_01500 [Natrinema halophilum]